MKHNHPFIAIDGNVYIDTRSGTRYPFSGEAMRRVQFMFAVAGVEPLPKGFTCHTKYVIRTPEGRFAAELPRDATPDYTRAVVAVCSRLKENDDTESTSS